MQNCTLCGNAHICTHETRSGKKQLRLGSFSNTLLRPSYSAQAMAGFYARSKKGLLKSPARLPSAFNHWLPLQTLGISR